VALLALNSGVVLALWLFRFDPAQLGELEVLMIVNCIVGLLMGAVVTRTQAKRRSVTRESEKKIPEPIRKFQTLYAHGPPSWSFTTGNPATLKMFRGERTRKEFISYEPWENIT